LSEAQEIVAQLMDRAQDLSLELRPAILDHLGLVPALLLHFERYRRQTGVRVHFEPLGAELRFAPQIETGLFRIVQEGLTNVARHAGALDVSVSLWLDEGTLGVQIDDEGRGFDVPAALSAHGSVGLSGMQERVELLGGQLTIESAPGKGTQISVEIPLSGWLERRNNERDDSAGG
jgi:signal transduction histidine kinase